MRRRATYKLTTSCCGRTLYRGAHPGTEFHCFYCNETRRPAGVEMLNREEGACYQGHEALVRDGRGKRKCVECGREATRRWRSKVA